MKLAKCSLSGIIAIFLNVAAALCIKMTYELEEHSLQGTLLNPMMFLAIILYLPSLALSIYVLNNRLISTIFWGISLLIIFVVFSTNLFE